MKTRLAVDRGKQSKGQRQSPGNSEAKLPKKKKNKLGNTRNTRENAGEKVKMVQGKLANKERTDLNTQEGAG